MHDPTSVVRDDKKDIYNNIILFTVLEDAKKSVTSPAEMHIFQCHKTHSAEIVDEIYKAKEGRPAAAQPVENKKGKENRQDAKHVPPHHNRMSNAQLSPLSNRHFPYSATDSANPTRIELEVQVLNHCFDDIERFVTRLQNSTEFYKELERRQKHRKTHKKLPGDGMLSLRAQMPPPNEYIDIFQKFKHSFNLLAKLKAHIHDPNAPELVHFLFTPLSLIVNTTKEQPYRGLSKTVWIPLLTKDAKDLLLNCLTSKEQDLWLLLGDSWSVTAEEAKQQPHTYSHLDNQSYNPVFFDGWSPAFNAEEEHNELSKLAFATAAQVQAQSLYNRNQLPIQKQRYYSNTQPQYEEPTHQANRTSNHSAIQSAQAGNKSELFNSSAHALTKANSIRNNEEMKKWAIDLCYRGAK